MVPKSETLGSGEDLADRECRSDELPQGEVALELDGEGDGVELADVDVPLGVQAALVNLDVLDLADELGVQAQLVHLDELALDHERELRHRGRIDELGRHGGETGDGELVGLATRDQAEVVGLDGLPRLGRLIVKALRATMLPCEAVAFRSEMQTQGGLEQAMPPQAAVITLGRPSAS